jgi:lipoyl(octanoyl) transferase
MSKLVHFRDLGLIDFKEAWDFQQHLFDQTVEQKFSNRKRSEDEQVETKNYLLFCEHPPVYTLGKSGKDEHMLLDESEIRAMGANYYQINRGGDITFHGPGQLVGYPILDLDHFFTDIHKYLRFLEEVMIKVVAEYGLEGERSPGETGVWLDVGTPNARKICAMGIKASRWVTMHGWALNVNNDLGYFNNIIPCGIHDKEVTSLEKELGRTVSFAAIKELTLRKFEEVFETDTVHW